MIAWYDYIMLICGFLNTFQKRCEKLFIPAFFFRRNLNNRQHPYLANYKKPRQRKADTLLHFVYLFDTHNT